MSFPNKDVVEQQVEVTMTTAAGEEEQKKLSERLEVDKWGIPANMNIFGNHGNAQISWRHLGNAQISWRHQIVRRHSEQPNDEVIAKEAETILHQKTPQSKKNSVSRASGWNADT